MLALAASNPQRDQKGDNATALTKVEQRGTTDAPLIVETHPAPKTAKEAATDQAELQRQRDKDAAALNVEMVLAGIGTLQLVVFSYQAWKLRQTVKEGKDAIDAAVKAANATEKYAEAVILGEQPYMFPNAPDMSHFLPDAPTKRYGPTHKTEFPAVGLSLLNLGKSTCVIRAERIEISIGETIPPVPTFTCSKEVLGETVASAGASTGMVAYYFDRHLTPEERGGIFRGEIPVNLFGYIVYADIFGSRHKKGFCLRSTREQVLNGSWRWNAIVVGGGHYNYRERSKASPNQRV